MPSWNVVAGFSTVFAFAVDFAVPSLSELLQALTAAMAAARASAMAVLPHVYFPMPVDLPTSCRHGHGNASLDRLSDGADARCRSYVLRGDPPGLLRRFRRSCGLPLPAVGAIGNRPGTLGWHPGRGCREFRQMPQ